MRSPGCAARARASCGGRSRPRKGTPARLSTVRPRPPAPHALCRVARRAGLRPMPRARGRRHAPASLPRDVRLPWRWLRLRRHALLLARGPCRFGGELVCPLLGGQGLGELFEVAAEGGLKVVGGDADAVVGDASLREVIRADFRRTVAGTDLGLAEGAFLLGPLAHLAF